MRFLCFTSFLDVSSYLVRLCSFFLVFCGSCLLCVSCVSFFFSVLHLSRCPFCNKPCFSALVSTSCLGFVIYLFVFLLCVYTSSDALFPFPVTNPYPLLFFPHQLVFHCGDLVWLVSWHTSPDLNQLSVWCIPRRT